VGWADAYIADLKAGKPVSFRPKGNSMAPKIQSGQLVHVRPVSCVDELARGSIVLCKVNGKQFLHLVGAVRDGRARIENAGGHVNGWTSQVYGVLIGVEK